MRHRALIALCALTAAGCQTYGGPGVSTYFECERGTRLQVDNLGSKTVLVRVNGARPLALKEDRVASGAAWTDGPHRLHTKGDEALWTVGRMVPESCRQVVVPR